NLRESMAFDMLVLDSLPVLEMLSEMKEPRNELFHFFEWLRDLDVTTIIIAETPPGTSEYGKYGEDFLSDGIFHLKMERVDDMNIQRRIRCVKMRDTNHSTNYFTLMFENGKFQATRVISDRGL
ncbi:MAG: ATPase domain-containing protein, partial [Candidatus Thermoplasmatota archaeon]|nr:ATPase domain-containing protein [Candidatus Thermoplasmatota archaeon]